MSPAVSTPATTRTISPTVITPAITTNTSPTVITPGITSTSTLDRGNAVEPTIPTPGPSDGGETTPGNEGLTAYESKPYVLFVTVVMTTLYQWV
ncbi:hypothetical protein DPMN_060020 [Dreissena polymorpha]|uniref:Uncharacterized protein n=1 Tax=Dreissena polymorpha TaxID=45954 RepID=A0A9D4C555_DREPO|nr:hypothetical protein DPMN_060020 [Dreissena polymorpha]